MQKSSGCSSSVEYPVAFYNPASKNVSCNNWLIDIEIIIMWNKNFIFLTLSNFLMCITYYAMISVLPVYLVCELHSPKSQVGMVMAAYTIASVLIRPFSGFALEKFGRRMFFIIALCVYSFLFLGFVAAITIAVLTMLRFLQGLTWGIITISGSTIAVDIIPPQNRGEGIGYYGLSTTMGMSVGPIVGLLICHLGGYTAMFVSGTVIGCIGMAFAASVQLPRRLLVGRRIEFKWTSLFDSRSIVPSLNLLIIMITYGGLLSFVVLFGREIGIHNPSSFFLIFAIGIALSRVIVGKVFDKNGPGNILTICLTLLIVSFPMLALFKNEWGYYFSAISIGFGIGVVFPTFQTIVNNLSDAGHRGAANSTLFTALDLGMGLGMSIAGFIAQHISISAIFYCNAVICFVGLFVFRVFVLDAYSRNCIPNK